MFGSSLFSHGGPLSLDLSKLKDALPFRTKPRSSGLMLDVRITVQHTGSGALLWDVGDVGLGPRGGQIYVRPADTSAAIVGMLALRLDEMEREFRRTTAGRTA
jgi:hypothetical protein